MLCVLCDCFFFFQAENGIQNVTEFRTGALPIFGMGVLLREAAKKKTANEKPLWSRRAFRLKMGGGSGGEGF